MQFFPVAILHFAVCTRADILVSLVRSKAAGHIRDVRRLVVAMSRARLGLYIFGRRDLFAVSLVSFRASPR